MLKDKKLFLLDIDGTICKGEALLPGAAEFLRAITRGGGKYIFITNNATRNTADYIRFFRRLGVKTGSENYITASYATIRYVKEHYADRPVYLLATESFAEECRAGGIRLTDDPSDPEIACVLVSYDNQLTYDKIRSVCLLLSTRRVDYIATNPDMVCPVEFGYLPDCGAICEMIASATHRTPHYIGKPETAMVEYALQKTGVRREQTLLVGDRLYTDILCGQRAGVDTALVLSGEATLDEAKHSEEPPTYIFPSVAQLQQAMQA